MDVYRKKGKIINHVLENEKTSKRIQKMRVEERINSDHQPMTIWVNGEESGGEKSEEERVCRRIKKVKVLRNTLRRTRKSKR